MISPRALRRHLEVCEVGDGADAAPERDGARRARLLQVVDEECRLLRSVHEELRLVARHHDLHFRPLARNDVNIGLVFARRLNTQFLPWEPGRSEEHTSELQSHSFISYA